MLDNKNSNKEIKRIVILGHSGFIGSHLGKFFKNKTPGIEVIGQSLPSLDLTKDSDVSLLKDFFDMNTAVIMCSAVKKEHGDNLDNFIKNILMVVNLCKLMEKYPVRRFLYFSSAAVYGEDVHNLDIQETSTINPTSYYGIAKYNSEKLLQKTIEQKEKSTLIIIRPPVIYGPGDKPCYGPSGFIESALIEKTITLWGDGTELREFIFIGDIVKLVNNLIFHEYEGVLNIASGKSSSFAEIINILSSLLNVKIKLNSRERTKNKVDNKFNNEKLRELFPEFSFTPLKEGLLKTIEYFESQKKLC